MNPEQDSLQESNLTSTDGYYSEKVSNTIKEVLPSTSVFDDDNFDVFSYINSKFPTFESLEENNSLSIVIRKIKDNIDNADEKIKATIQKHNLDEAKEDLKRAKEEMNTLYDQIKDIQEQATNSEQVIANITKDIKALDYGKNNLENTIGELNRVNSFQTFIEQLKVLIKKKQYNDASQTFAAVNQLYDYFQPYRKVSKIKKMMDNVHDLRVTIKESIMKEFERNSTSNDMELLRGACLIIDQLGDSERKVIIQTYTNQFIKQYKAHQFQNQIDSIIPRFDWCHRAVIEFNNSGGTNIFPAHWAVKQECVTEFCIALRRDVDNILESSKDEFKHDISRLYKALRATIDFEKRWTREFKKAQEQLFENQNIEISIYSCMGHISPAFEPYMESTYVKHESAHFDKHVQVTICVNSSFEDDPMLTAQSMSLLLKKSFENVVVFSTGSILFGLVQQVWKKNLIAYSSFLKKKVNSCTSKPNNSTYLNFIKNAFDKSNSTSSLMPQVLSKDDLYYVSSTIKVISYLLEEIESFEDVILDTIDDEYKKKVTFKQVNRSYFKVMTLARDVLVMHFMAILSPPFEEMTKMNWAAYEEVTSHSSYIEEVERIIEEHLRKLAFLLPQLYFKSFCERFTLSLVSLFMDSLQQVSSGISMTGAQQLLMDIGKLKNFFKRLLSLQRAFTFDEDDLDSFVQTSHSLFEPAERFLKVLSTPTDKETFMGIFDSILPSKHRDGSTLEKVLNLKMDMNKAEKQALIEQYGKQTLTVPSKHQRSSSASEVDQSTEEKTSVLSWMNRFK